MNSLDQYRLFRRPWTHFCLLFCLLIVFTAKAQEKPPRPITVTVNTAQYLSFGVFIQNGTNGAVTVDYNGTRSSSGSIILPSISSIITPALFIVDAEPGTLVTIMNGPTAILSGNNGGTLILTIGESSVGNPFITRGKTTNVYIGGTLQVGALGANPAGFYNGSFQVTFIQQ